jgi:predicted Zn-dependent peptidase
MKKIFSIFILSVCISSGITSNAQMGKAYEMTVNGVKVIVQPSGNDIVVIQTLIRGGVQNYSPEKAGIEALALTALTECGTMNDDKNSFKNKLDKVSAQIGGYTEMDYATFRLNCIKSDFDKVWPLYTDAMLVPKFESKEFDRIRQDQVNKIRSNESNPDYAIDKMARETAFSGKNYAKNPDGTVETIEKITVAETKKYWESILNRSRMVIVVVADLDKAMIEKNVKAFLDKIPKGTPLVVKKESYTPPANTFKPQERENATNYIQGITSGPQPGSPDYNAFVLAMRIFGTRHFVEIRTKHGLSYAPGAWFSAGNSNYTNLVVSTTEPDKYIAVTRQLIDKVKNEGFTKKELKNTKVQYLTGVYYRQETNDAQASSLAANELIHNNWRRSNTINADMKNVTLEQINNAFKKYISHITWSYQGDPKKVNPALFTQKETPVIPEEKKAF